MQRPDVSLWLLSNKSALYWKKLARRDGRRGRKPAGAAAQEVRPRDFCRVDHLRPGRWSLSFLIKTPRASGGRRGSAGEVRRGAAGEGRVGYREQELQPWRLLRGRERHRVVVSFWPTARERHEATYGIVSIAQSRSVRGGLPSIARATLRIWVLLFMHAQLILISRDILFPFNILKNIYTQPLCTLNVRN
jgi:hypothetical protein